MPYTCNLLSTISQNQSFWICPKIVSQNKNRLDPVFSKNVEQFSASQEFKNRIHQVTYHNYDFNLQNVQNMKGIYIHSTI